MASIRKRGERQWEARIRRRGYGSISGTFDTKYEAEMWARDIESSIHKNTYVSTREAEKYTLFECLDRYIEEYIPRLKNPKRETDRARAIQKRPISSRIVATIRAKDIADYRRMREADGVSGNTIRLEFALLSRLFNFARSDWGMESLQNPVTLAAKPKISKGRDRRLEAGEEALLISKASTIFASVIQFALATAMRREEIATLRRNNINFQRHCAYLPETKNSEARTVPLSSVAIQILKCLPECDQNSPIFGMTSEQITNAMRRLREKTGIKNLRFHDLRHEATSRFFENTDLDVMEIKAITGHKTLQMLSRYTHLRVANLASRLDGKPRG